MRAYRVILVILGVLLLLEILRTGVYGGLFALVLGFMLPWAFAWALFDDVDELKSNINRRVQSLEQAIKTRDYD
ncbi:hypothetical protein [Thermococcus sp. MV11]|uniref:hypothetical protein n=1 Tax=Thermococcus sp. MV11 TaxID=1638267 RepID=UPI0014302104|nr:hypothetical protein [Thermococcus sp. MV11]NJE04232.1 hypothetical protein [Thermococcus sp. MV11]